MRKFEKIRTEIKRLSELQTILKSQRKESFKGERMPGSIGNNKWTLRHLFQAYAVLKGKPRPEVFKPSNYNGGVVYETFVQKLVEEYKPEQILVQE